jgi:4-diphosphocytidyl-2-C-methyl-D-erythritol kinase
VLSAACKINLALEVLGRRDDGYHEIATVMQAVDLSDRLVLEDADILELRTTAPDVPTDGTNLALKAAMTFREMAGVSRGARITLDKRIPVAAGLGGGSTDAAAVLVGLNRLWGLGWSTPRLAEAAVKLGMDVPFFLHGGAALATGRGERLEPLACSAMSLVLVNPRVAASTAEIYGGVVAGMYSDGALARGMATALRSRQPGRVAATLGNTLERVASARYREVEQMRRRSCRRCAGSGDVGERPHGAGIARSYDHARQIRGRVARARWGCWRSGRCAARSACAEAHGSARCRQ